MLVRILQFCLAMLFKKKKKIKWLENSDHIIRINLHLTCALSTYE